MAVHPGTFWSIGEAQPFSLLSQAALSGGGGAFVSLFVTIVLAFEKFCMEMT